MIYDLIIVGGGPAGVAAGVYAARKRLKTLLITESFGGQSTESMGVENWIGTIKISGVDLGKMLQNHLEAYAKDCVDIKQGLKVLKITKEGDNFLVETSQEKFESKTVLIATGSTRRKLDIPGAKEFENKGITYCASCDAPLFGEADVVIIGGGNAAFESAAQLLAYAKSVTILTRSERIRADETTVMSVLSDPKVTLIKNALPKEIKGDKFVSSIVYTDALTGTDHQLDVSGIFVEIGLIPTTTFLANLVNLNDNKQIIIDPKNQRTSLDGVWAAGDSTDGLYHQNNIAAGDAIKALEDIYLYIHTSKK